MVYDDRDDKRNISKKNTHAIYSGMPFHFFLLHLFLYIYNGNADYQKNSIKTDRPFYSFGRACFLRVLSH